MRPLLVVTPFLLLALGCATPGKDNSAATTARPHRVYSEQMQKFSTAYLKNEGPNHRGPHFETLAIQLMMELSKGAQWSREDIKQLLGPPDLRTPAADLYAYFYDRLGARNWVVYVSFDGDNVKNAALNDASVNQALHARMVHDTPP